MTAASGPPDPQPGGLPVLPVSWATLVAQWGRIGCIGFGGPPAHISLLRRLCVSEQGWLSADEFEAALATVNLLPGPASTQLAIYCALRVRGRLGAVVGGLCFIVPGLIAIIALAAVFLGSPPHWLRAVAAGAASAVAAVAVQASVSLAPASWRATTSRGHRRRWIVYLLVGAAVGASAGEYLVVVLLGCGALEVAARRAVARSALSGPRSVLALLAAPAAASGGLGALAWVALKVGALSYGGGFVIIPLMQSDAVHHYHWMTNGQFLNAVALGQLTPGPVVQTVSVVGYAAAGVGGALLAAVLAFAPSFGFVLAGGPHVDRLRANASLQAFLSGAGPAAIGGIAGSAIPLALALSDGWQAAVLAAAGVALVLLRRTTVFVLVGAALCGLVAGLAGLPIPT